MNETQSIPIVNDKMQISTIDISIQQPTADLRPPTLAVPITSTAPPRHYQTPQPTAHPNVLTPTPTPTHTPTLALTLTPTLTLTL